MTTATQSAIRSALESRLATLVPALPTAYENVEFTPPQPQWPYERVTVLFATPYNPEIGRGFQEIGYMQVDTLWPIGRGSAEASVRAEAIRALFDKGVSIMSGSAVVQVDKTPAIGNGRPDAGRWSVPVKVPFFANNFGA